MQKVRFIEFAEVKRGDGSGPQYLAGKAYWLPDDKAEHWKSEGIAEDAPEDVEAQNEKAPEPLRPDNVRLVSRKGGRFDVVGPENRKFNKTPLDPSAAERLRLNVLDGHLPPGMAPEPPAVISLPEPITFRQDVVDGKTVVYVLADWPKRARFSADLLKAGSANFSMAGDRLNIAVANGIAEYRVLPADALGSRLGYLVAGTYEGAAPAPLPNAKAGANPT